MTGPPGGPGRGILSSEKGPSMQTFRFSSGTRVRLTRGPFPLDASMVGRTGIIVETDDYRPGRYGVQLDGETRIRDLHEDEIVPLGAGSSA